MDGLTVSLLVVLAVAVAALLMASGYALKMLRRIESRQLTALRDILRSLYHER